MVYAVARIRHPLSGMSSAECSSPMLQPPRQDAVVAVGTDCPQSRFIWLIHVIRERRTVVDRIAPTAPSNLTVINKIKWSLNGEETVEFSGPTCTVSGRMVFRRAVSALFLPRFCAMKTLKERRDEAPASCRADRSRKLHLSKVVNGAEMVQKWCSSWSARTQSPRGKTKIGSFPVRFRPEKFWRSGSTSVDYGSTAPIMGRTAARDRCHRVGGTSSANRHRLAAVRSHGQHQREPGEGGAECCSGSQLCPGSLA